MIKIPAFSPKIEQWHEECLTQTIVDKLDLLKKSNPKLSSRQLAYIRSISTFIKKKHGLIAKAEKLREFVIFIEETFFKWHEPLRPPWDDVNKMLLGKENIVGKIFDYDGFRDASFKHHNCWGGAKLMRELVQHVKYCPYCNADTVYALKIERENGKEPTIKSAFDHFFPRGRYPFLSVSLYNLIPSCYRCNSQLKSDSSKTLIAIPHPYIESLDDSARFIPVHLPINAWQGKCCDNLELLLTAKSKCDKDKVRQYNDIFHLSEVYTQLYQQDAFEAIQKAKVCNDSYLSYVERMFKAAGVMQVDVHKMVFGVPHRRDEIDRNRLAKLILDIKDQFGAAHK